MRQNVQLVLVSDSRGIEYSPEVENIIQEDFKINLWCFLSVTYPYQDSKVA
jgi:hypothetical protein